MAGVLLVLNQKAQAPTKSTETKTPVSIPQKKASGEYRIFTGQEFEELYNSFAYPNTQLINESTPITGDLKADKRIRELAIAKGYRLRTAPVTDNFVSVQKDMLLQQRAAKDWTDMKNRAHGSGIELDLSAAYRSAGDQKTIFLQRLSSIPVESIAEKKADAQVNKVLEKTAPPGYSRHHSGYTVDIACKSDPGPKFENSECFDWLSKQNYINAKTSGWIPSYPPGAGNQGPEPESWEYVWVGTEALK